MKNSYNDGKIVSSGYFYEEMKYNVSNEKISAVFDGKGAVTYYSEADESCCVWKGFSALYIDNTHIDVFCEKSVKMIGRYQKTTIYLPEGILIINQFLGKAISGVFCSYEFKAVNSECKLKIGMNLSSVKDYDVFSNVDVERVHENAGMYVKLNQQQSIAKLFLTFSKTEITQENIEEKFDSAFKSCIDEIEKVRVPEGLSEIEKALFYSGYFCALQNYKQKGDYKGFMAGHVYLLPMRTYYRDSYYTVLPMYNGHCDKVRAQIITLAEGIAEDGTCPSAVKSDYSAYWENHYDSPSFLAIMLYDYVKNTGDKSILDEKIGDYTVHNKAVMAIFRLAECESESGLLYKEGKYNKRDWADAVNRWGYVTYDEILYARAWYSLSKLSEIMGEEKVAKEYFKRYEQIKKAINEILWSEELGYYINFRNEEYTEDNLSLDTVWAAIFGIADKDRAIRMLTNMERLLEVKNNKNVKLQDFGVMCVYPAYSKVDATYFRSSQPYHYHNGGNWPYLSAIYAYAKRKYGMEYKNALLSWFTYNVEKNNFTPIEYFSAAYPDGSLLQAWSGVSSFVLDETISVDFWECR